MDNKRRVIFVSNREFDKDLGIYAYENGYSAYAGPMKVEERWKIPYFPDDIDILWVAAPDPFGPVYWEEYSSPEYGSRRMWVIRPELPQGLIKYEPKLPSPKELVRVKGPSPVRASSVKAIPVKVVPPSPMKLGSPVQAVPITPMKPEQISIVSPMRLPSPVPVNVVGRPILPPSPLKTPTFTLVSPERKSHPGQVELKSTPSKTPIFTLVSPEKKSPPGGIQLLSSPVVPPSPRREEKKPQLRPRPRPWAEVLKEIGDPKLTLTDLNELGPTPQEALERWEEFRRWLNRIKLQITSGPRSPRGSQADLNSIIRRGMTPAMFERINDLRLSLPPEQSRVLRSLLPESIEKAWFSLLTTPDLESFFFLQAQIAGLSGVPRFDVMTQWESESWQQQMSIFLMGDDFFFGLQSEEDLGGQLVFLGLDVGNLDAIRVGLGHIKDMGRIFQSICEYLSDEGNRHRSIGLDYLIASIDFKSLTEDIRREGAECLRGLRNIYPELIK